MFFASWVAACRDSELYRQTNGGSRYTFDPEYGGKIDVAGRRAREDLGGGDSAAAASEPARPPPDRPRVRELFGSEAAARYTPVSNLQPAHA